MTFCLSLSPAIYERKIDEKSWILKHQRTNSEIENNIDKGY